MVRRTLIRPRRRRLASTVRAFVLPLLAGLALVATVATSVSATGSFSATANVSASIQYVNDHAGTVFTFTVKNTGTTPIGAVEIARPSPSWAITSCPDAPTGWSVGGLPFKCRYTSPVGPARDLLPGHTSNHFQLRATVRASINDLEARWTVVVSRTSSFGVAANLRTATTFPRGLTTTARSLQILDALVLDAPATVGAPCPVATSANHSSVAGSTGHTVAICGRNRSNVVLTPLATSFLGGTLIASHGGFTSGPIGARTAGSVVLGNWANVTITPDAGSDKTIIGRLVAAGLRHTSHLVTLAGYTALNTPPIAELESASTNEDTASSPITLRATDANGHAMTFGIVTGPAHGTLDPIVAAACPATPGAPKTCTATVVYHPAANYNGSDIFTYQATDSLGASSVPVFVTITIAAVNDAPVVVAHAFSLAENSANGTPVGTATYSDPDTGQTHVFSITAGNTGGAFAINSSSGAIAVANSAALNYETNPSFSLTVRVTDSGSPVLFGSATLTVNLTNVNEAPVVAAHTYSVPENSPNATAVGTATYSDPEAGQTHVFSIAAGNTGGAFAINSSTGAITVANSAALNYETNPSFSLTVQVTDNGSPVQSGTGTITVNLTDVNEAPVVTAATFSLPENSANATPVGTVLYADPDAGQTHVFSITAGNTGGAFGINSSSGAVTVANSAAVDYETNPTFSLTVQVTDNGPGALHGDATITINLTNVNEAPVVNPATFSLAENSPNSTAVGTATYSDPDSGQTHVFSITAGNSGGAFAINSSTGAIAVANSAALNYETNPSFSLTVQVTDNGSPVQSGTGTITVNLTDVNEQPNITTTGGSLAYTENGVAAAIDTGLTVSDVENIVASATVQITTACASGEDVLALPSPPAGITVGAYVPGTCTLSLSGTSTPANYQTALRAVTYFNSSDNPSTAARIVTFSVTDDGALSDSDTHGITVAAVNDAPSITAPASLNGALGIEVSVTGISLADPDAGSANVSLVLAVSHGTLHVNVVPGGVTPPADGSTVTLTDSLAKINTTLADAHGLIYQSASSFSGTSDTLTLAVDDLGHNGPGPNGTASASVTINLNATPVANNQTVTTDEDTAKTITLSGSDTDAGDTLTYRITSMPTGGGTLYDGTDTSATQILVGALPYDLGTDGVVTYLPSANANGTALETFQFVANDTHQDSAAATVTVNVTAVNDAPVITASAGSLAYTENATTAIDPGLTVTDIDDTQLELASVYVTTCNAAQDVLGFVDQNGITGVYTVIGCTLTLSGTASVADYQAALRSVTYHNSSDNPDTTQRTATFNVNDGDVTASGTRTINITAVNDPPVVTTSGGSLAYTENDPATAIDPGVTVTDPDSALLTIAVVQISTGCAATQDVLALASPPSGIIVDPSSDPAFCQLVLTGSASPATYQAALRAVTYFNSSDDPSTAARTVRFSVSDGSLLDNDTRGITITAVNDAPIVANKSNDVTGNVGIGVPAGSGVLVGVSDPEGNTFTAELDASNASFGDIVIGADGSYTFNPKAGRQGTDTVKFRVCDTGTPVACSAPHDLKLTVTGMIWFVDNNAGSPGDGRISSPLDTLAALQSINDGVDTASTFHPASGDTIFLYRNVATDYTGGLTLLDSQKLVGAGATASLGTISGITLAPDSVPSSLPATGATRPNLIGGLVLGSANTVRGLTLGDATTSLSGSGFGTLTLGSGVNADLAISTTGRAISLTTGTVSGDLISVTSMGGTNNVFLSGISSAGTNLGTGALSGASGDSFAISGGNGSFSYSGSITTTGQNSVDINGKTGGTVALSGPINDTGQGIRLTANTGASVNLTGGVIVSSGTDGAFIATGGGTISVTGATNALTTTTGTALNVANTTIGASGLTFRSVSANGAASGIILNNTGSSGGLTVTGNATPDSGGTIQNISGTGHGISLTSTRDVSLAWMNIQNTGGSGIFGTGVTNFSFVDGTINNSGTGGIAQMSNIAFNNQTGTENNLSGTVTITGNTLTNARYHGVSIFNFAGTISDLNVSNNALTSSTSAVSSVGGGIQVVAFGSASAAASITKATLDNNVINNFPSGVGLQVQCGNANSAAAPGSTCGTPGGPNVIAITNNKINATGLGSTVKTGAEGIIALVNGVGQGNFNISDNTVQQNAGTSISSSAFGNATIAETISGNTVVSNNTVASQGIGVGTSTTGGFATNSPHLTATITNNDVSQTDGNGILAVARDSSAGQLDVSIKSNTVAAPLSGVRPGIRIDAGNSSGDNDVCLALATNTSAGSGGTQGIGLRKQGTSTTLNAFGIEGMGATSSPGVEAFVDGLNPAGNGTLLISATSGFSSCSSAP